jgi:hypothetical protein
MIRAGDENAHAPGDCPPMPTPYIVLIARALVILALVGLAWLAWFA